MPPDRWAPSSSAAVRAGAGESGDGDSSDDGFSFADLQRELNRRRTEEAVAPDTKEQQQEQQQVSSREEESREAFMEEQMVSCVCGGCGCGVVIMAVYRSPLLSARRCSYC